MSNRQALRMGWLTIISLWSGMLWSADLEPVKKSETNTAAGQPYNPEIAPASAEGENAIKAFRKPANLDIKLVAAEPLLANPVCFCIDEKGRILVAETFRQQKGVEDNRSHMNWLDDDLAAQTVEDRLRFFEKHLKEKIHDYSKEQDRIRLLEDADGDGKFEKATIFADGFNGILQGTGAGLLSWRGNVYYTCIPDLWLLRDNDGDGKAEHRKSLHYGYGVRVAFRGHDSHGLRMGPDGRIYFSIGDRGYHIETEGRTLARPECGAVFRCNPDGSNLEVVATGLRNPQELVFDQYGNLFTGDNNSDSGDKARWTYIPEGADIGWRMYYQYLSDRGPWNREKIWHPAHEGQPAYIVPCITNLADGPSGLTYYPGWGLSERYQNHFFLADFRGGASNSGIRSFSVKPKGASFEVQDSHEFIWQILATDVEFGYDGGLYVSDWVSGWNGPGKGRMYRFSEASQAQAPLAPEVKKLFADGFTQRTASELAKLLTHVDYRVRLEAQLALADQGATAAPVLTEVAQAKGNLLARLHAIWGLGQLGRRQADLLAPVLALLDDGDSEVRVQAAKVLGEAKVPGAVPKLIAALRDPSPRVRMQAALTLGHYGDPSAVRPLLTLLEDNNNQDATLRHGAVMGLAGSNGENELRAGASDGSPAARLGVLLAWRRLANPEIVRFLNDTDPFLVDEAARAIHDVPIPAAMPALAKLTGRSVLNDETWRRVISANFRSGTADSAAAVAQLAARADLSNAVRTEALNALGDWTNPKSTDRVLGDWRPLAARNAEIASAALPPALGGIFAGSDEVRKTGSQVAAKLGVKEVGPALMGLVKDLQNPANVRVEALRALQSLKDKELSEATKLALADASPIVRSAGQRLLATQNPDAALKTFQQLLTAGTRPEQQSALSTLAEMQSPEADAMLARQLQKLNDGQLAPELQLDVLEAAGKRDVAALKSGIAAFDAARPKDNPLAAYVETLQGGDAQRGRTIFYERSQVSCVRCHKIGGQGGEVGPDLTKIGTDKQRFYLLEAIVDPNRQVAKGFETVVVTTTEGRTHAGILKGEDADKIQILTAEAKLLTIPKAEIDERANGKSSMPESLVKQLSKQDLRDLVEFLASLSGK